MRILKLVIFTVSGAWAAFGILVMTIPDTAPLSLLCFLNSWLCMKGMWRVK